MCKKRKKETSQINFTVYFKYIKNIFQHLNGIREILYILCFPFFVLSLKPSGIFTWGTPWFGLATSSVLTSHLWPPYWTVQLWSLAFNFSAMAMSV